MTNEQLAQLIYRLERRLTMMSQELDNLKRAAEAQSGVVAQLAVKVGELKTTNLDPAELDHIRATVEANTQALVGLLN